MLRHLLHVSPVVQMEREQQNRHIPVVGKQTSTHMPTNHNPDPPDQKSFKAVFEMGRGHKIFSKTNTARLFVSAVLSLISILISPVLSTDAMWNVISAETGTGTAAALETSMANICWYPQVANLNVGQTYLLSLYSTQANTNSPSPSFFLMNWKLQAPYKLATANAWGLKIIRSVVLTEAKTMYAGGAQRFSPMNFMQIHTMAYNTGTGLYSQTDWFTNSGFSFT